jgi:hypothetical protein
MSTTTVNAKAANYDHSDRKEGATFTNAKGNRTVKLIKRTSWAVGNYNNFGWYCEVTTPEGTYCENMTARMIEHRYPVKADNLRYTVSVENLTAEQMQSIVALLGKDAIVTRTN